MWDWNLNFYGDACFFFNPPGLKTGRLQKYMDLNFGFLSLYRTPPPMLKTMEAVEKEVELVLSDLSNLGVSVLSSSKSGRTLFDSVIKEDKKTVVLSLQGLPEDVNAKKLVELGVRIIPLMYGSGEEEISLFTPKKEKFVAECIEQGLKIDLSHCNHATARDAVKFIKKFGVKGAMIATHTGCYSVYNNPRNLHDDVIGGIAEMDGIVGISTITFHLHEKDDTINSFLRHIQHAVSICGEDNVAVGSDRPYVKMGEKWGRKRVKWMQEKLDPDNKMGIRYPDQPVILNTPQKMSVIHSEISPVFNQGLADKICGENLYWFIKKYI